MATDAVGSETPTLFLRKATGLVRGWSVRDTIIYACLSTNFVTLGLYEFTFAGPAFPKGQMLTAVLISAVWVSFLVIAYSGLIVTIPRAGGDYVWQSRILGSGIGFVMAATGWWFILWLWAPIYGNILSVQLFEPIWATLKWTWPAGGAAWFGTDTGIFVVTLITVVIAGLLVSLGMGGYAKVQKWCFFGGMIGFAVIVILLLVSSHTDFVNSFNLYGKQLFGVNNAYNATNTAAAKAGYTTSPFSFGPLGPTMLLVPAMMFFILWPNWGATLYGEIRGASDFRRVFTGMFVGLWITVLCTVIFFLLVDKTIGWGFYQNLNSLDYNVTPQFGIWPYPFMFAAWLVHNTAFQVILILVLSLWFFAWVGTLFLSSTRVIFAAAFDRVLPDRAAEVSEKRKVPVYSLILMLLPAAGLGAVYAYSTTFRSYTLDATLVIAVTYLFSAIAVVLLPFVKPDLWRASPASRVKLLGVPIVPLAGLITIGLLVFNLYEWLSNDLYFVNSHDSLYYMAGMYVLAIVIYVGARVIRKRQGIDLGLINKEIPVE
ncbi:APC family permease [Trebonia sp.]|uniref:APC family permease n=1 Tax=Trebonia sp. TaxID=2767075 RepID=UPI002630623F|nr:APC family permease [Trebonia sp.]